MEYRESSSRLNQSESGPLIQSRWTLCWDSIPLNLTDLRDLSIASRLEFRVTPGFLRKVYSSLLVGRLHSQLPGAEELPELVQKKAAEQHLSNLNLWLSFQFSDKELEAPST